MIKIHKKASRKNSRNRNSFLHASRRGSGASRPSFSRLSRGRSIKNRRLVFSENREKNTLKRALFGAPFRALKRTGRSKKNDRKKESSGSKVRSFVAAFPEPNPLQNPLLRQCNALASATTFASKLASAIYSEGAVSWRSINQRTKDCLWRRAGRVPLSLAESWWSTFVSGQKLVE